MMTQTKKSHQFYNLVTCGVKYRTMFENRIADCIDRTGKSNLHYTYITANDYLEDKLRSYIRYNTRIPNNSNCIKSRFVSFLPPTVMIPLI